MPGDAAVQAAAFLRRHAGERITLADVGDAVGYSPFHLGRMFTAELRMSPMRYLACHRFHLAKQLLLNESLPVVDVCHEVGFSSPGTFIRRFRAEVGVSPQALRQVADEVAETTPTPFRLGPPAPAPVVAGRIEAPPETVGPDPLVWVGLYPQPVPAGLPGAGLLRRGAGDFRLPLREGHPWLLATVVPEGAGPLTHLAADAPLVAVHPEPLTRPAAVVLRFRAALPWEPPILTALPALRKIGVS